MGKWVWVGRGVYFVRVCGGGVCVVCGVCAVVCGGVCGRRQPMKLSEIRGSITGAIYTWRPVVWGQAGGRVCEGHTDLRVVKVAE